MICLSRFSSKPPYLIKPTFATSFGLLTDFPALKVTRVSTNRSSRDRVSAAAFFPAFLADCQLDWTARTSF